MTEEQFIAVVNRIGLPTKNYGVHRPTSEPFIEVPAGTTVDLQPDAEYNDTYPERVCFKVTGTGTIEGFDLGVGVKRSFMVLFEDVCTLVDSSTLRLPGAANYTTSPGDFITFGVTVGPRVFHQLTIQDYDVAELFRNTSRKRSVTAAATIPRSQHDTSLLVVSGTTPIETIEVINPGIALWLLFNDGGTLVHSDALAMPGGMDYEATANTVVLLKASETERNEWSFVLAITLDEGIVGETSGSFLGTPLTITPQVLVPPVFPPKPPLPPPVIPFDRLSRNDTYVSNFERYR